MFLVLKYICVAAIHIICAKRHESFLILTLNLDITKRHETLEKTLLADAFKGELRTRTKKLQLPWLNVFLEVLDSE